MIPAQVSLLFLLLLLPLYASRVLAYVTRPELSPVPWDVTYLDTSLELAPGYTFMVSGEGNGMAILEDSGEPVYLDKTGFSLVNLPLDFRPQVYNGEKYLAYWAGEVKAGQIGHGDGYDYLMDSTYQVQYKFSGTNLSDFHELNLNGNLAVATMFQLRYGIDTTAFDHGAKYSYIYDGCIQDIDPSTKDIVFSWCAYENGVSLEESFYTLTEAPITEETAWDYIHTNSIDKDNTGYYLLSGRHTHTVYYISPAGAIVWRLGGKNSTFSGDGTTFAWQHHVRFQQESNKTADEVTQLKTRYISMFNNNASETDAGTATESQGLLIELDLESNTARIVTQYHSPGGQDNLLSTSQGANEFMESTDVGSNNVQVSYGILPIIAEYTREGEAIRVVNYTDQSYRVFKTSWMGTPLTAPDAALRGSTLYASWNGATEVAAWQVLQGDMAKTLANSTIVVKKTSFETVIAINGSAKATQAVAVDADGKELGRSAVLNSRGNIIGSAVNGTKF